MTLRATDGRRAVVGRGRGTPTLAPLHRQLLSEVWHRLLCSLHGAADLPEVVRVTHASVSRITSAFLSRTGE